MVDGKLANKHCSLCGENQEFLEDKIITSHRENFKCFRCGGSLRQRLLAHAILAFFGELDETHLAQLAQRSIGKARIHEFGIVGPFSKYLRTSPAYSQSCLRGEKPEDSVLRSKDFSYQDIRSTSFAPGSIELAISVEVLEHVFEPERAYKEVARILRPGGVHIFSTPLKFPLQANTTTRAEVIDGEISFLQSPHYHRAPGGQDSLVVSDFGKDIQIAHQDSGMRLMAWRCFPVSRNMFEGVFVAQKIFLET